MQAPEHVGARLLPVASRHGQRAKELAERGISVLAARPLATLAALALTQWAALLCFAFTVRRNGWVFGQGGDAVWPVTTAWLAGLGELAPSYLGYAWPLVLAPITLVAGPTFLDALPAIVLLNVLVLGPLALWAIFTIAARIAGRAFGLLAAAAWVVAPYCVVPLWRFDYHERYVEQVMPQALGLTALPEYPAMVLLLVGAAFFVRALETRGSYDAVAAGLVAAFAIGLKPSNAFFLVAPVLAAAVGRNLRPLLAFALALAPALATLALWKYRGLGSVPVLGIDGQRYVDLDWENLHDNASLVREFFWSARLVEWLPLAGVIGVARRSPPLAAFLGGWFAALLVVKGSDPDSTISSASFFRFLLPAFPAYLLLAVSTLLLVPTLAQRVVRRWPDAPPRQVSRRLVVGLGVALAIAPLLAVALLRPVDSGANAVLVGDTLTPVDDRIDVAVEVQGDSRVLTWSHPAVRAGNVFYRVFRAPAGAPDCSARDGGAAECTVELELLGATRERFWRDRSPVPGTTYRVGVAANAHDDPAVGGVASVSRAAAAT
jgi:hypothetical protein